MINNFEQWLNESEGFSLRGERAYGDLIIYPKEDHFTNQQQWNNIKQWLKGAFDAGYEAGEFNKLYLIQSLRSEIRTLNKEIAGLREERRIILDKDYPPGYKTNIQ